MISRYATARSAVMHWYDWRVYKIAQWTYDHRVVIGGWIGRTASVKRWARDRIIKIEKGWL